MKKYTIIFAASCASFFMYSCESKKIEEKVSEVKDTIQEVANKEMGKMETDKDNDFIKEAGKDGTMEVAIGKVAKEKALSKEVKSYAKMLVHQHEEANKDLM